LFYTDPEQVPVFIPGTFLTINLGDTGAMVTAPVRKIIFNNFCTSPDPVYANPSVTVPRMVLVPPLNTTKPNVSGSSSGQSPEQRDRATSTSSTHSSSTTIGNSYAHLPKAYYNIKAARLCTRTVKTGMGDEIKIESVGSFSQNDFFKQFNLPPQLLRKAEH
jgi:hypothetical protein